MDQRVLAIAFTDLDAGIDPIKESYMDEWIARCGKEVIDIQRVGESDIEALRDGGDLTTTEMDFYVGQIVDKAKASGCLNVLLVHVPKVNVDITELCKLLTKQGLTVYDALKECLPFAQSPA
jgi:hypothetical protein